MNTENTKAAALPAKPLKTSRKIERLMADFKKATDEDERHKQKIVEAKQRKDEILPNVRLTDAKSVQELSEINTLIEILPGIVNEFKAGAEKAKANLNEECQVVTATLLKAIGDKFLTLRAEMTAALEPFFPKRNKASTQAARTLASVTFGAVYDAESAVDEICAVTIPGSALIKIRARLRSPSFIERDVFKKAAELIEYGAVIDALRIVDGAKI